MNRLRQTDGCQTYDRYIRFTNKMLKRHRISQLGVTALEELRGKLRKAKGEWLEATEAYSDATDDLHIIEAEAEDELRITFNLSRTADTRDQSLGAVATIFPNKLTAEIAPRGSAQAVALREVADRIDSRVKDGKLPADHEVACQAVKLRSFADSIDAGEQSRDEIALRIAAASAQMRLTKARIREQVEGVYGALVIHFASRPRFVSRFFRPRTARRRAVSAAKDSPELPESSVEVEPAEMSSSEASSSGAETATTG